MAGPELGELCSPESQRQLIREAGGSATGEAGGKRFAAAVAQDSF